MSAEVFLRPASPTPIDAERAGWFVWRDGPPWLLSVVVHLGLFWVFFLVHRPLLLLERVVALFAYAAFAFINGNGLLTTYAFLEAVRSDLVRNFGRELANAPATAQALGLAFFGDRQEMILITHGVAFAIVAGFVMFRNTIIGRYERLFPKHAPSANLVD